MDFSLTDEQQLLRDTARAMLRKECPIGLVRAHMDDPSAADALWPEVAGWVALGDGPLVDLCLFLEEMGRVLAPGPFFATTALFLPLARSIGHPLAEEVAAGRATGTVAMAGADGRWVVTGDAVRTFVLEADRVDHVAVVVPGPAVVIAPRLPARQVGTLDPSRRVFEVGLPDVPTGEAVPVDAAALDRVVAAATVALAAEMVGTARWLLDASVQYAKDRVQFDRPIGSFQAIQHKLADMGLAVERSTAAVYEAAMLLDASHPDASRAVHVAKAAAGEAATRAAKDGIQTHGGIGYTWDHDLHLYIRRAFGSEHLLGTARWHHDRLADLIFGPV